MSLIAGTIIFTRDDQSYFLVTDELPKPKFYTVKMHKHDGDTALGSIVNGMRDELGIDFDNLRFGELAAWHLQESESSEDLVSLYTFEAIDSKLLNLERLNLLGLQFINARDIGRLLKNVDMAGVIQLD
ncbi:hypothetical protein ACFQGR_06020 [Weissella sagaensis]|jgi:hypothetical protein|uniref:Uncharacterized protein n=1 Tax=Weissella sagaensis TaxID=2559928 RepID=A0ABW1RUV5_9LACO|nr:hypothetical protein [Weissella sagaensis]KAA8433236.1 hypothetical protein FKV79_05590 [Weissella paramesenteroides]MBU7567159.1 hypothetical protein [Weissella hellenica]KAA8439334.1 hypothetical protein FKV73_01110 [Weissella paramesenteroides]QDJ59217.1 hypothetical protein EFA59_06735 [Weissella hellenica]QEA56511.1 hypothetical protein FGL75_00840 [Weissella hellenica]